MTKHIHPVIAQLRLLRQATGLSLARLEERHGIPAVVLGSYERGDRQPTAERLQQVLDIYGYDLVAVPKGTDTGDPAETPRVRTTSELIADLHAIADQLERTASHDGAS